MKAPLRIPIEAEEDLLWEVFLLEAARGGVRVPGWVFGALTATVGEYFHVPAAEVTEEQLLRSLDRLPSEPWNLIGGLLARADVELKSSLTINPALVLGAFRESVGTPDLLADAARLLLDEYGPQGFLDATEKIESKSWDARYAVVGMMYVLLLRSEL